MRIAVFIKRTTFHKGYGGLETQNQALCEGLAKRGHQIVVFSPKNELQKAEETLNGVSYVFVDSNYKRYLLARISGNSWLRQSYKVFEKLHQEKKFDLVLSQSSAAEGVILKKDNLEISVVSISHGSALSEFKTYIASLDSTVSVKDWYWVLRNAQYALRQFFGRQRRFIHGSDRVVAVSTAVKESLIEETYASDEKFVVINNGRDTQDFEGVIPQKNSNNFELIFVGRVEKSKGVYELVDVMKALTDEYHLTFLGDGPDFEKLKQKFSAENLDARVSFPGKVGHSQVVNDLVSSDVFVFPTKRIEGFPMVLVECMLAGLPAVAFDMGGVKDAVINNQTGFLLSAGDIDGFVQAIKKLKEDTSLRKTLGENAKQKAETEFSTEVMLNKYEQVFEEVLK